MKELRETLKQIGLHYVEEYVYLAHAITLRKLNKTTNIFRRANELLRRGVQKGSEPWKRCFGNQPKRSHKKRSDLKNNKCYGCCEGSYRTKEQMGWPSCKTELIWWAKRDFQIADIQKIAGINWFQSALAGDGHERSHSGEE